MMKSKHLHCATCGAWFEILKQRYQLGFGMVHVPESEVQKVVPPHQAIPGKPSAEYRTANGKLIQTICDGSFREPSAIV